ncbi:YggS family pyridoxal phosphate-dependent enzyme [Thalassotalea euphylliae]|uniref:Pyridoxal phosphate homeostasis protein n=1 Tax=Thalassotalea euphylliae TaxID=1655234 RepID=A0A3E0TTQ3_9GAMM|nr:YggS family pyridoxal phosphate-dependent enzyme [Thalassotalea euphylliae]REL27804.1 YggS family pyridoxal phosphate-dependent enzyme [Thalassotalea euphylliae]
MNIKDNLTQIQQQIAIACQNTERAPNAVQLLAVSKTKSAEMVMQAYQAGQRHFGENYVQEAVDKVSQLSHLSDICWHFIGPIQSNKTRLIAENFAWVHSVDRIKIATRLNDQRSAQDTPLNICLQVNISGEQAKSGATLDELNALAAYVNNCQHLTLRGLMAIPQKQAPISVFNHMHQLFTDLKKSYPTIDTLSMGMTNDMDAAIAAGSTMVRIGTAIFGSRD